MFRSLHSRRACPGSRAHHRPSRSASPRTELTSPGNHPPPVQERGCQVYSYDYGKDINNSRRSGTMFHSCSQYVLWSLKFVMCVWKKSRWSTGCPSWMWPRYVLKFREPLNPGSSQLRGSRRNRGRTTFIFSEGLSFFENLLPEESKKITWDFFKTRIRILFIILFQPIPDLVKTVFFLILNNKSRNNIYHLSCNYYCLLTRQPWRTGDIVEYSVYLAVKSATTSAQV